MGLRPDALVTQQPHVGTRVDLVQEHVHFRGVRLCEGGRRPGKHPDDVLLGGAAVHVPPGGRSLPVGMADGPPPTPEIGTMISGVTRGGKPSVPPSSCLIVSVVWKTPNPAASHNVSTYHRQPSGQRSPGRQNRIGAVVWRRGGGQHPPAKHQQAGAQPGAEVGDEHRLPAAALPEEHDRHAAPQPHKDGEQLRWQPRAFDPWPLGRVYTIA